MPVFWHFRVLFYLQTFLRPLIFDTLLGTEVNQVCNVIPSSKSSDLVAIHNPGRKEFLAII